MEDEEGVADLDATVVIPAVEEEFPLNDQGFILTPGRTPSRRDAVDENQELADRESISSNEPQPSATVVNENEDGQSNLIRTESSKEVTISTVQNDDDSSKLPESVDRDVIEVTRDISDNNNQEEQAKDDQIKNDSPKPDVTADVNSKSNENSGDNSANSKSSKSVPTKKKVHPQVQSQVVQQPPPPSIFTGIGLESGLSMQDHRELLISQVTDLGSLSAHGGPRPYIVVAREMMQRLAIAGMQAGQQIRTVRQLVDLAYANFPPEVFGLIGRLVDVSSPNSVQCIGLSTGLRCLDIEIEDNGVVIPRPIQEGPQIQEKTIVMSDLVFQSKLYDDAKSFSRWFPLEGAEEMKKITSYCKTDPIKDEKGDITVHPPGTIHRCGTCKKAFDSVAAVRFHGDMNHVPAREDGRRCCLCGKLFQATNRVGSHFPNCILRPEALPLDVINHVIAVLATVTRRQKLARIEEGVEMINAGERVYSDVFLEQAKSKFATKKTSETSSIKNDSTNSQQVSSRSRRQDGKSNQKSAESKSTPDEVQQTTLPEARKGKSKRTATKTSKGPANKRTKLTESLPTHSESNDPTEVVIPTPIKSNKRKRSDSQYVTNPPVAPSTSQAVVKARSSRQETKSDAGQNRRDESRSRYRKKYKSKKTRAKKSKRGRTDKKKYRKRRRRQTSSESSSSSTTSSSSSSSDSSDSDSGSTKKSAGRKNKKSNVIVQNSELSGNKKFLFEKYLTVTKSSDVPASPPTTASSDNTESSSATSTSISISPNQQSPSKLIDVNKDLKLKVVLDRNQKEVIEAVKKKMNQNSSAETVTGINQPHAELIEGDKDEEKDAKDEDQDENEPQVDPDKTDDNNIKNDENGKDDNNTSNKESEDK